VFHEPLDYNLKEWNSSFDKKVRTVELLENEFLDIYANMIQPEFYIPLTLAGIPIGYIYYKNREPGILLLYAASFVGIPWAYSIITRFMSTHKIFLIGVGGVALTLLTVGYLYYLKALPDSVLGYLAAGGMAFSGLVAVGTWISESTTSILPKIV
jgi:hypothetical protein